MRLGRARHPTIGNGLPPQRIRSLPAPNPHRSGTQPLCLSVKSRPHNFPRSRSARRASRSRHRENTLWTGDRGENPAAPSALHRAASGRTRWRNHEWHVVALAQNRDCARVPSHPSGIRRNCRGNRYSRDSVSCGSLQASLPSTIILAFAIAPPVPVLHIHFLSPLVIDSVTPADSPSSSLP